MSRRVVVSGDVSLLLGRNLARFTRSVAREVSLAVYKNVCSFIYPPDEDSKGYVVVFVFVNGPMFYPFHAERLL